LKNLANLCADRGWTLQADALRSDLTRPLRPGAAELLHAQYTDLTAATTGESTSVHLADFPVADESVINKALEEEMKMAQDITSMVYTVWFFASSLRTECHS
jgi:valyl-tRNA synthetase